MGKPASTQRSDSFKYRWGRGQLMWWLPLIAVGAALSATGAVVAGLDANMSMIPLAGAAFGLTHLSFAVLRLIRSGRAVVEVLSDGGLAIEHPVLREPLRIAADDVHSLWHGPFHLEPRDEDHLKWWRQGLSPSPIVEMSKEVSLSGEADFSDSILIVLSREMSISPARSLPGFWALTRYFDGWSPRGPVTALLARLDGPAASLVAEWSGPSIRDGRQLPADVHDWVT